MRQGEWSWLGALFLVMFGLCVTALGCAPYKPASCEDQLSCDDHDTPAEVTPNERSCECIEKPSDGFTGPSLYWIGAPADMPGCPEMAPFDGIDTYADPSPAVEPPCVTEQSVKWGLIARECKTTTYDDLCSVGGATCAPAPPPGFALCVYHDDETLCSDSEYPTFYKLLRASSAPGCAGTAMEAVTLCCAGEKVAG